MAVERCECIGWVREYGVGRPGEMHHRNCRRWSERLGEAYVTRTELIVTGDPGGDEQHNCDFMGCSTVSHVVLRLPLSVANIAWDRPADAGVTPCCPPGEPHAFDCPNGVAASEVERLRAEQAAGVMPQIGPRVQAEIRWALLALSLVRNRLTAMGIKAEDENGTALVNLDVAITTLEPIAGVLGTLNTNKEA